MTTTELVVLQGRCDRAIPSSPPTFQCLTEVVKKSNDHLISA